jgi:hypothetical protein
MAPSLANTCSARQHPDDPGRLEFETIALPRVSGLTGFAGGTFAASGGKSIEGRQDMVVLGLILLIIGLVAGISILTTIGAILLVVGIILNLVPIGGTRRRVF